jgi:hypothetical protein
MLFLFLEVAGFLLDVFSRGIFVSGLVGAGL